MLKKIGITLLIAMISGFVASAQKADAILGQWVNPNGQDHILIYKKGNKYFEGGKPVKILFR